MILFLSFTIAGFLGILLIFVVTISKDNVEDIFSLKPGHLHGMSASLALMGFGIAGSLSLTLWNTYLVSILLAIGVGIFSAVMFESAQNKFLSNQLPKRLNDLEGTISNAVALDSPGSVTVVLGEKTFVFPARSLEFISKGTKVKISTIMGDGTLIVRPKRPE